MIMMCDPRRVRLRNIVFIVALIAVMVSARVALVARAVGQPPQGVRVERDIPYVADGDPAQKLDLYLPEHASSRPLPLVVWIHGGGWEAGSKDDCPMAFLVGQGYAAASIEYRFSQKAIFPAQIEDCQAAIRWLRANSKRYNLDAKQIGVCGASAGGHLAALLGTAGGKKAFPKIGGNDNQSDRVQAVVDLFGPSDFNTIMSQAAEDKTKSVFDWNHGDPASKLIGVDLGSDKKKSDAVSPVHYVSRDNPPFLIMHGTVDPLVPYAQSVEMHDALQKSRVEVILQRFPGSGHGGPAFVYPAVLKLIKDFYDKELRHVPMKIEPLPGSVVSLPARP